MSRDASCDMGGDAVAVRVAADGAAFASPNLEEMTSVLAMRSMILASTTEKREFAVSHTSLASLVDVSA